MTTNSKNYYFYIILKALGFNLRKNYYELNQDELSYLDDLANVLAIKSNEISRSKKLWYRAQDGRPF